MIHPDDAWVSERYADPTEFASKDDELLSLGVETSQQIAAEIETNRAEDAVSNQNDLEAESPTMMLGTRARRLARSYPDLSF